MMLLVLVTMGATSVGTGGGSTGVGCGTGTTTGAAVLGISTTAFLGAGAGLPPPPPPGPFSGTNAMVLNCIGSSGGLVSCTTPDESTYRSSPRNTTCAAIDVLIARPILVSSWWANRDCA